MYTPRLACYTYPMNESKPCQIGTLHCEGCGSTDREDLTDIDEGHFPGTYSSCCNEPVVWPHSTSCTHERN